MSRAGGPETGERSSLEALAARFGRILDSSLNEIFVFELDGLRFRLANRASLENTGYSIEELRKLTSGDLHAGLEPGEYERKLKALRDGSTDVLCMDGAHRRKDGSVYPTEERVQIIDDGIEPTFVSIVLDVSERRAAGETSLVPEQELQRTQRLEKVGTYSCGILHDLNNLLMPVLGHTELALDAIPAGHTARPEVEAIYESAVRARDLAGQILQFARRGERRYGPVDLSDVLRDALRLIRLPHHSAVEVQMGVDDACPPVWGDAAQLHQLVVNLAMNAFNAIGEAAGILEVRVEPIEVTPTITAEYPSLREGPHVRLLVRDTGVGMERETAQKIFEPFFTTGSEERTGLGLSMVRDIVMGHQGAINVESEPGRGTAFWVYLPAEPVVGEQAAATGPEPIGGSARILVIDDEPIITRLLERSLTRLGYAVDVSNSGPEALEAFRAKPDGFDLALVDLIMPDLTGEEIVAELHRIRPGLPVLIMTGSGAAAPHVPSARGHLGKPFTAAKLAAALREALSDDPMPGVNEEALALLSEREKEVARAFYRGQEAAGIAAELFISPNTVQNHFKSIYRKLGVHSRVELLRILRRSTS